MDKVIQDIAKLVYGDALYYASTGVAGTTAPIGTKEHPCSSLANLCTIAAATGIHKIIALTNWTLNSQPTSGLTILGKSDSIVITLGGQDVSNVTFDVCTLSGIQGGAGTFFIGRNCIISAITNLNADLWKCYFAAGASTLYAGSTQIWRDCYGNVTAEIDGTGFNANVLYVHNLHGYMTFSKITNAGSSVVVDGSEGRVVDLVTNTAGTLTVGANIKLTRGGGGITIVSTSVQDKLGAYTGDNGVLINSSAKAQGDIIHTELETTTLDTGDGSVADHARLGELARYIADNVVLLTESGLAYEADVTTYTDVNNYKSTNLIGYGNSYFKNWSTYVLWDKAGAGAAPQNEMQANSASVSADGSVTHTAFTAPLEVGDKVLVLHPSIAALINATYGLAALQTLIGAMDATATNDTLADITTTSMMAKLRRIILRFSSGAFTSTINGSARTDIENMMTGLASYMTAAGAAYSAKVNNQTLRTNFEQIFQDFLATVGCDGTNSYSVTAQGASQTTQKAALYAIAQYMAASGAAIAATVNPGGTSKTNIEEILEDLGIMLAGGAGIITWPGSVKWGNGVSFAEALAFASDEAETIHTEVETTSVATGGGSNATLTRAGLLLRYIADNVATGNKVIIQDTPAGSATVITASEITEGANFWKGALLLATTGTNAGQARPIVSSVAATSVTVFPAFDAVVAQNDVCVIISAWRPDVWNQQTDVAVNTTATNAGETSVFDLSTTGYSYAVNSLRLKFADPGANTITVRLYELINDASVEVDSFTVDTSNYTTYHSLMDMFGMAQLSGDNLKVTIRCSAGGPYACTGQYQYALARTA